MRTTLPVAELANLHFVTPQLAVGGDCDSHDDVRALLQLAEITELGITHVVDVRVEWSDEQLFADWAPSVTYLHHGLDDLGQAVPPEWFERAVSWVETALTEHPDAVVLTHCHMGINRGPSLGFALLLALGWDPVEAIGAVRTARPQANVWYAADALTWHHGRNSVDPAVAADQHAALQRWRDSHPLDVVRIIRETRAAERVRA